MKRGSLRFIPLQADLCLNKQKVDIEDFKGWQKCNAPVYGGCLSPLYKKEGDHHDIFKGDDYYDWTNGVLYKNGVEVLRGAGSKKIKKTKTNLDYKSMALTEDDVITYIKETSGTSVAFSIHGGTEQSVTIPNCNRIVDAKAFANSTAGLYGIAVLYLHTNGSYGYYLNWIDGESTYNSYGSSDVTTWTGFEVVSPLIQVGIMGEHTFLVSFFGTSGASLSQTSVRNVFVKNGTVYDNPTFYDDSLYPRRYATEDGDLGVHVSIRQDVYECNSVTPVQGDPTKKDIDSGWGVGQQLEIVVLPHEYATTVHITDVNGQTETFEFPASDTEQVYIRNLVYRHYLYDRNVDASATQDYLYNYGYNAYYCGNVQPVTGVYSFTGSGSQLCPKDAHDTICQSSTYSIHPFFFGEDGSGRQIGGVVQVDVRSAKFVNDPEDSGATTVTNTYYMGKDSPGLWVETYGGDVGDNYHDISDDTFWYNELINAIDEFGPVNCGWVYGRDGGGILTGCLYTNRSGVQIRIAQYPAWIKYTNNYDPFYGINGMKQKQGVAWYNQHPATYGYFGYKYKTEFVESSLKEVDCCMDDGYLYCVGALTTDYNNPLPTKLFGLSGEYKSFDAATNKIIYETTSTFNIAYDEDDNNVFPKYYAGMNISIQNHYLRVVYLFKAKPNDTNLINILVDSLEISAGEKATSLLAGVQQGSNANLQGGVKNTGSASAWRLLFNNNMLSNVACYENKDYIGTILADWFTADGDFCIAYNSDTLYYKDNNNTIWKLELITTGAEWEYRYIEDRYIVLNTTNYFNCYDTKTGLKRHWASDYNNRIVFGKSFSDYTNDSYFGSLLTQARFRGFMITSQNANYEETKDTITSIEIGAINYEQCLKDYMTFISCGTPYGAVEGIDLYRGDNGSTAALYICSFLNKLKYINNDLVNPYATYPISEGDIRYNPNLFTVFIKSYNNKDMVISDGIAYKLIYYNNVIPIMAYNLLDGVEELLDAFVLQTSYYGVSETRLYQMNYSNGVGVEVVADITGLEYLGALPSQALFWSAQNRAIYTFRGDCIMQLSQYANELTGIFGKWYNPATQELFLDTNIGILVFSDLGTYCLEWSTETEAKSISDIFFFKDRFLINLINDTSHTYYYSYNNLEGYTSNGIKILTKYYGNGLVPVTVNNIYVRLYNQSVANAAGSIVFKGHTITDIGVHTDTKTVEIGGVPDPEHQITAGEEWDSETNTMLVKYTPQYNRGLGFSLEIDTTFPIIDIKFDYVENGAVESQVAHINI